MVEEQQEWARAAQQLTRVFELARDSGLTLSITAQRGDETPVVWREPVTGIEEAIRTEIMNAELARPRGYSIACRKPMRATHPLYQKGKVILKEATLADIEAFLADKPVTKRQRKTEAAPPASAHASGDSPQ